MDTLDTLEILNTIMERQEHGKTLPMHLKISLDGQWCELIINREDKNLQKMLRTVIMLMLRNEIDWTQRRVNTGKTALENARDVANSTLQDYTIRVITGWDPGGYVPFGCINTEGPTYETVTVRAHSERDACVMAYLLKTVVPEDASPTHILAWAERDTKVVR